MEQMETKTTEKKDFKPLHLRIEDSFNFSMEFCQENKLLINSKEEYNFSLDTDSIKENVRLISKNQRKKLNRILNKIEKKRTLKSMNILFHYLSKKFNQENLNIKITSSIKENEIIKIRDEYKKILLELINKRKVLKELKSEYKGIYTL